MILLLARLALLAGSDAFKRRGDLGTARTQSTAGSGNDRLRDGIIAECSSVPAVVNTGAAG
jgi:hypothetical protein